MKLSEADSDLFFKLMWRLLLHVNRKGGLIPGVHSVETDRSLRRREPGRPARGGAGHRREVEALRSRDLLRHAVPQKAHRVHVR